MSNKQTYIELHLMQQCVDNASDAVFWVDDQANFIYVNKAACRHMGYSRDELLSKKVHDVDPLYQEDNWSVFWSEFKQQGSIIFESINRTQEGKEVPVEIAVNYQEHAGKEIMHANVRDITKRKQAIDDLLEAHDRLEQRVEERTLDLKVLTNQLKSEINERKNAEGKLLLSLKHWRKTFDCMSDFVSVHDADFKIVAESFLSALIVNKFGMTKGSGFKLKRTLRNTVRPNFPTAFAQNAQ